MYILSFSKLRLVRSFIFIPIFLLFCNLAALSTPQISADSTWAISTILLDQDEDDTLDFMEHRVTVGGIANTSFPQVHTTRMLSFIQNTNYGIPIFTKALADSFSTGDSLVVKGKLHNYNGLNEIYVESYEVFPQVDGKLKSRELSATAANTDKYIGMLVQGQGKVVDQGTVKNGKYIAVSISDTSSFEPKIFISNFHDNYHAFDFDVLSIGDEVAFTGVLSKFIDDHGKHHHLVYLRTTDDLQYSGLPKYYFYVAGGITLLMILGAAIWIISLRKKVNSKTEQIQQSLQEKDVLLREIHHRVKNNLSIISGLLDFQKDTTDVESTHNALQDSQSRIRSMALIHDKLYQSESLSGIRLDEYLRELIEAIGATFINESNKVEFCFDLEPTQIDINKVVPCGLLINELVVNSYKHAFNKTQKGILTVELKNNDPDIILAVADDGPGLPENFDFNADDSLGSMLIQTFANQLNAEITINPEHEGAAFIFTFPLE